MVTGRPSSAIPHGLRGRCTLYSKPTFRSVTMVSAAEEQLWSWGSTWLPQRMMADVNPTVTVEQRSALAASWSPVVTHFPTAMTLQAKAAVLKCPLCAKSGVSDKLHICLLPEAQSEGPERGKCSHLGDAAAAACGSAGLINAPFWVVGVPGAAGPMLFLQSFLRLNRRAEHLPRARQGACQPHTLSLGVCQQQMPREEWKNRATGISLVQSRFPVICDLEACQKRCL